MRITQQTSTRLQFRDRRYIQIFVYMYWAFLFMGIPLSSLLISYSQSQFIQLKCETTSSSRSEPCTLSNIKALTVVLESEPVKSVRVKTLQNEDSTTSELFLVTQKGEYNFPYLSNEEVKLYSQRIEKMLQSRRVLGTQLETLTIEKDVRFICLVWSIASGLATLFLSFVLAQFMLSMPTHANWIFDKSNSSIVINFYQFFRHVHHHEILFNQVQKIDWRSYTNISRNEDYTEIKTSTIYVGLVLRSGEAIALIPSVWSDYWTFRSSEACATTISHFLDIEAPELLGIIQ